MRAIFRSLLLKSRFLIAQAAAHERGTVAVMMGLLFPIIVGGLGLGVEVTNWYLKIRSMQNAADSSVIAAASNAGSNYDVEGKAVASQYGFIGGSSNVSVTVSNSVPCPGSRTGALCYKATISKLVPLYLSGVVGYSGDAFLSGTKFKTLVASAFAIQKTIQQPVCLFGLDSAGTAIRSNGGPNTNFTGCSLMSNSGSTCNGSNLNAYVGMAHAANSGCGLTQYSYIPAVADPYASIADNIPTDLSSRCSNAYTQETRSGSHWVGGNSWSGSLTLTGTASTAGNTLVCGDLRLTGDVTINAPAGAALYVQNGRLDLNGYTFRTASGSSVSVVFTGDNGTYTHAPVDLSGGSSGVLDIQAPTSGPFSGLAIYQDPRLTSGVDVSYAGNSPTWNISGGVYMPEAQFTISGAVNKSASGADCFMTVAKDILINGTGSIYQQTPDGSGCREAGLPMPTATIAGRSQLVY